MTDQDLSKKAEEYASPVETVLDQNMTVKEAMMDLRTREIKQEIIYFYAVDEEGVLKGVVSTRQLLLAAPDDKIKDIMLQKVVKIRGTRSLRDVMEAFEKNPLLAIPVIDQENKLIGAIDVQKVTHEPINFLDQRSRMDAFQMIGITLEEKKKIPIFQSYRHRIPWLLCNVFSGLVCALISRIFEGVLEKVILLAFFIPLVLTLSESTSMQAMAQSIQFLRRPRFYWRSVRVRALREWHLVFLIAISLGILVGVLSLLWGDALLQSVTIAVGIIAGVTFSSFFAISVPIFLNRMKLDPKVASGPVVLMLCDIIATAVYLGLATWWLL